MKVKELDRTVNVAWSPAAQHPIMIAAGTAAQQLDASFSTSATLEIYSLNLSEPGHDMELRTSVPSDYRFHKIAWGSYGFGREQGSGIIVGGCDGGRVQIYSSAKLLAGEEGIVARQDKHTGPVRALDFNPYQANLLATGASDSEIYIWDLNNTATPMLPGAKSQPAEDVLWISWNKQVQHILASTFSQRCVVWDLRKNEPIIKLSDANSRIRWKVVAWHPEVATQLCLASEEDQTPVIQLWDLRFATSPLKVLQNHQRGVLSIAWCAQDPDLLVSCGKDNRILCWNPNSNVPGGEIVCDLATTNQWNFDVSWCPRNPALIVSSSFDGHVSVYSLTGGQQQVQTSNKIADSFPGMDSYAQAPPHQQQQVSVDLLKPPKWLKRPCGASFGFGGKLVTFENCATNQSAGEPLPSRSVYVSQVVTEPELISRSNQLEQTLQYGQFMAFCEAKAAVSTTEHHRSVWTFLRANFEPNHRAQLLNLLGFKQEDVLSKLNKFTGRPANARTEGVDGLADQMSGLGREAGDMEGSAVFDAIAAGNQLNGLDKKQEEPFKISTGDDPDGLICQALLLGNIETAVELCLQEGRMADAIILAMTGGADLLAKTQYRYFQQNNGYLATLISAVVTEDWSQVISSCEVESWKEALAAALTHTKNEEFPLLCEQLGQRLEVEGKGPLSLNAQLCYICAGNLNRLVESWINATKPSSPDKLQDLVELVMVLQKAVEQQGRSVVVSGKLAELLSNYASILASQGNLDAALTYLGDSEEEQVSLLRERLQFTLGHKSVHQHNQSNSIQPKENQRFGNTASRQLNSFYQPQVQPPVYNQSYPGAVSQQPQTPYQHPAPAKPYTSQPFQNPALSQQPYASAQTVPKPFSPGPAGPPYGMQPQQTTNSAPPQNVGYIASSTGQPALGASTAGGGSSIGRSKYVLDPSVQSGPAGYSSGGVINPYSPGPTSSQQQPGLYHPRGQQQQQPGVFAPAPVNSQILSPVPTFPTQQNFAAAEIYNPAEMTAAPHQTINSASLPNMPPGNAPPGWNDPPALTNALRNQPKIEYTPQSPITHPLYGSVPQETMPSNMPNMNGGYVDSVHSYTQVHQQQQYQQQTPVPQAKIAEPPKPKDPIPEEHMYLQTVFDELRNRCTCAATNPQSKRKLEDVARKLETLYDALRESRLSANTLQGLHQMVQMVQIGDYTGGLGLHTHLVSGPDFSQIATFMPGLKVLLQSALQLGVYLQ